MKTLDELRKLEKNVTLNLDDCNVIVQREYGGITTSVVEKDGKYYRHTPADCFEVAMELNRTGTLKTFSFTPDNMHIYQFNADTVGYYKIMRLSDGQIEKGMSCSYKGVTMTYKGENLVAISNGDVLKTFKVEDNREFTYKFLKTRIKAIGGAKGLYSFFEQIAEQSKHGHATFGEMILSGLNEAYFGKKTKEESISR